MVTLPMIGEPRAAVPEMSVDGVAVDAVPPLPPPHAGQKEGTDRHRVPVDERADNPGARQLIRTRKFEQLGSEITLQRNRMMMPAGARR